jgi:hypothetical protein
MVRVTYIEIGLDKDDINELQNDIQESMDEEDSTAQNVIDIFEDKLNICIYEVKL